MAAQIWTEWENIGPKTRHLLFFKCGSLVFPEIAYNDSLQQYPTSSRGKIHEKITWGPNLGQRGQNWSQNQVFLTIFSKFGSLAFLEIANNNILLQCITFSRGKTHKKILRPNLSQNGPKSGPKLSF